jgi:hypothetical protein
MTEAELYEPVMSCLRGSFAAVGKSVHLEIAATKGLSEQVKRAIPMGKEIVFSFLRQHRPDIIGVIEGEGVLNPLVVAEVKAKSLTLDDVYQAKQYKEVLEARGGILVTVHPIPEDLRRLCAQNWTFCVPLRTARTSFSRSASLTSQRVNSSTGFGTIHLNKRTSGNCESNSAFSAGRLSD